MGKTLVMYMPEYLAQWLGWKGQPGECVTFRHNSVEDKMLRCFLTDRPAVEACPHPGAATDVEVHIALPDLKLGPYTPDYLPASARKLLLEHLRARFDVELNRDLLPFMAMKARMDDLLYAWMEKKGIEASERNYLAVQKRYDRQRRLYNDRRRKKK